MAASTRKDPYLRHITCCWDVKQLTNINHRHTRAPPPPTSTPPPYLPRIHNMPTVSGIHLHISKEYACLLVCFPVELKQHHHVRCEGCVKCGLCHKTRLLTTTDRGRKTETSRMISMPVKPTVNCVNSAVF